MCSFTCTVYLINAKLKELRRQPKEFEGDKTSSYPEIILNQQVWETIVLNC